MTTTDRATGVVTLVLGVWVVSLATRMVLLAKGVPGPGLLPLITGLLLTAFGAMLLIHPGSHNASSSWPSRNDGGRVAGTVIALVLFTAAVPFLGFPIATALFLTGMTWWWGDYKWWVAVLVGVLFTLAMVLVFQVLLHAPLPRAAWG